MTMTRFGAEFLVLPRRDPLAEGALDDTQTEIELGRRHHDAWRHRRLLETLLPGAVAAILAARRARRLEAETKALLAGMSPHLRDDIGMGHVTP